MPVLDNCKFKEAIKSEGAMFQTSSNRDLLALKGR